MGPRCPAWVTDGLWRDSHPGEEEVVVRRAMLKAGHWTRGTAGKVPSRGESIRESSDPTWEKTRPQRRAGEVRGGGTQRHRGPKKDAPSRNLTRGREEGEDPGKSELPLLLGCKGQESVKAPERGEGSVQVEGGPLKIRAGQGPHGNPA